MNSKIEGLIIKKTPFKERDLIVHLLLRSGRKISIIFHGGQGGGKKKKSSILELGHMIWIELSRSKSTSSIYRAREWGALWTSKNIRKNYNAFSLMCFYLEIIGKVAPEESLHDELLQGQLESVGGFTVLSNAIFYLDKRLEEDKGEFHLESHVLYFLGKILLDMGIFPDANYCIHCNAELAQVETAKLVPDQGGFACTSCSAHHEKELWTALSKIGQSAYKDITDFNLSRPFSAELFNYFCYQMQLSKSDFRAISVVN
jgi:recombinational DNA repair protein (RecF pathway)